MARKGLGELTGAEKKLLIIAAKLLAALQEVSERPPEPMVLGMWQSKVTEELVRTLYPIHARMLINPFIRTVPMSYLMAFTTQIRRSLAPTLSSSFL